ncbi:class I SAM-dependent methyltransferase [Embleya sp. NPDC127516]|uniref:class I SAM-dependent methyltransferase n=1 Tax=Embleya sp. NPDC127516 TaxID=3363990 RepID=UPI003822073C
MTNNHGRIIRVLDLYCCGGGAARGYQLAGCHVTGVDIAPQPRYRGDVFVRADAIEYVLEHGHRFDFVHASPPCQKHTTLNAYNHITTYPDLIAPTRDALTAVGRPWVIENVPQAPLLDPTILCGAMFGLRLYRHRAFETGPDWALRAPEHPAHVARCVRNGYLPTPERPFMSIHGGRHSRAWQHAACDAMRTPWLKATGDIPRAIREVSEAIPPAYTHWIATRFLAAHTREVIAA